jgi:PAS domain S-box-containing protein
MSSNDEISQPSVELFQSVLDALPFCVFWKDRNSVGLGCNQALADIAGLHKPKDYIGKTDYDLPWTKEEADFFRECDRRVMDSGEAEVNIIESQKQADGQIAWLETSKIPLTDENGNILGILGAFHDITERKRIEDENIASQKLDSLGALAAGLAHDFNNVLGMILASSQLAKMKIANGADEAQVIKHLDSIEEATKRASVLTEKFMNYSERGEVTKVICDVSVLIEESIAFVQSSTNSSILFKNNNINPRLYADVNQIHQVINNLLLNAAQASPNNAEIIVSVQECAVSHLSDLALYPGSYLAVSIKDSGVGISDNEKDIIFNPYFTTKDKGHGLGLSSCQTIIKNHNGAIDVKSKIGVGSTFTVYLPIAPSQKEVALIHHPFSKELVRGSGRILYIEDDLNTQASIVEVLEELGYEVQNYSCLELAIDYIRNFPNGFDMVITDFIIGDNLIGGRKILDNVRLVQPSCPVILLTAYFKHLENRADEEHAFSYIIQKPIDFAKISQIVSRFSKKEVNIPNKNKSPKIFDHDY